MILETDYRIKSNSSRIMWKIPQNSFRVRKTFNAYPMGLQRKPQGNVCIWKGVVLWLQKSSIFETVLVSNRHAVKLF